jgi:gamma-glutamyltranspeptidase
MVMRVVSHEADVGAEGRSWGVATPHPAATDAAAAVLTAGGTAVDAAIAAAGVLVVAYPHNCSVGGDLIGLVRAGGETPRAVFGVGRSAHAIDAAALRGKLGERVPVEGPFSISVPGVVSGWQAMHELGGSRPFGELLQPAIELAEAGVPVSLSVARALTALESNDPGLQEIFGPPGGRIGLGQTFVQPRLAETLAQVARDPECYYRGDLAERLANALQKVGSPITREDFAQHHAVVADAVVADGGDLAPRLFTAGPPSQGIFFSALVEVIGRLLARGYDLLGDDAAVLARAFAEISKLRDDLLSDPSRWGGADVFRQRVARIDLFGGLPPAERGALPASTPPPPSGDTVAIVTYDSNGSSVSMLQSIFHSFGSRVLDPETGVLFHNRQSMFTLRRGSPGELGPGLMPPHTLCPAMVDGDDGRPSLVLSTMGGRAQPQILSHVLLELAAGKDAARAVSSPRYVVGDNEAQSRYSAVTAERDVASNVLSSLGEARFSLRFVEPLDDEMGHAQVLRVSTGGVVDAASDPRSDGTAMLGGGGAQIAAR